MNYRQCLAYLDRLGNEVLTLKFGLETIRILLDALGNPHQKYPSVLVTGTNGKGSVVQFLNSIFSACGIHNGSYTSPHLVKVEDRFQVNNNSMEPDVFTHHFTRVTETISRMRFPHHPTYFETLTATAFLYFAEEQVKIVFLEIGMGGRLDSTNVVDPLLSIFTPIGFDHQNYLGESLQEIAREKAGIIHPGRPLLLAPQRPEVREVILSKAVSKRAQAIDLDCADIQIQGNVDGSYRFSFHTASCALKSYGCHQVQNAALAIQAAEILQQSGFSLSLEGIQSGVARTHVHGVLQKITDTPTVFLDGAHNQDAAKNLVAFLKEHTRTPRSLVFGMMRDKDVAEVSRILKPCFERVYLTRINSLRAASVDELRKFFPEGTVTPDPLQGYSRATTNGSASVTVAGSFYLVGAILEGSQKVKT